MINKDYELEYMVKNFIKLQFGHSVYVNNIGDTIVIETKTFTEPHALSFELFDVKELDTIIKLVQSNGYGIRGWRLQFTLEISNEEKEKDKGKEISEED